MTSPGAPTKVDTVAPAADAERLLDTARRAVSRREAQLRSIADEMPLLMWSARSDGYIDWYNKGWYRYTGQTPEEAAGWGWQAVHHPDDFPRVMEAWPRSIATGEPFELEFRLRRHDGAFRWFLTRATPVRDAAGHVERWYGTNTDVHDEHTAADQLHLFANLGSVLASSLDLPETLDAALRTLVPDFVDWSFLTLVGEDGDLFLRAAYHPNPSAQRLLTARIGERFVRGDSPGGSAEVIRTGRSVVFGEATYDDAAPRVLPAALSIFAEIYFNSVLIVPLLIDGQVRGTIHYLYADGRRFESNEIPFFEEIGRRIAPAIGRAETCDRQHHAAEVLQSAALPKTLPSVPGFAFHAVYQAGSNEASIGGDWYDAFCLDDGSVVLSIGDVTGSGLDAAVIMGKVRQNIRAAAQLTLDPGQMLKAADKALRSEHPDRLVTAFVGVLTPHYVSSPHSRALTYASAGHPPGILRRTDGTLVEL